LTEETRRRADKHSTVQSERQHNEVIKEKFGYSCYKLGASGVRPASLIGCDATAMTK